MPCIDRIGDAQQQAPAIARRDFAPGGQGVRRRLHRTINVGSLATRYRRDGLPLRRIFHGERAARGACDPGAVDQHGREARRGCGLRAGLLSHRHAIFSGISPASAAYAMGFRI